MQGMKFLMLNEKGKPFNHGDIVQRITPEKYLCQFTRIPPSARVCTLEEIQGWHLFPTDDSMNEFIAVIQKADAERIAKLPNGTTPPDKAPPGGPQPNKKKTKKKVAKKKVTKKSPGRKANVKK